MALFAGFLSMVGMPTEALASQVSGVSFDAQRGGIWIRMNGSGKAALKKLENPARLIIDIPQSSLSQGNKRFWVKDPRVKSIRIGQYSIVPAIVRVVVDLNENAAIAPAIKPGYGEIFVSLSEGSAIASETQPTPTPVAKVVAKPVAKPIVKIAVKPTAKPVVKPVVKIAVKPTAKPVVKPISKIVAKPVIKIVKHAPMPTPMPNPTETPIIDLPPVLPENTPTPIPTPKPTPMFFSTPDPILTTPKPAPSIEPIFSENPPEKPDSSLNLSSLHLVWQQLDVQETYPILNADSTYDQGTTYGVLTDYKGLNWKHWFNGLLGLSLEGRMASFKLIDRVTETTNDRSDITAHPALSLRYSMGMLQPEASLGYLYRSTTVKPNADLGDDTSVYPTTANLTLMGPTIGGGLRVQLFRPLALKLAGYMTPFTTVTSTYQKTVQESEPTFKITPLGDSRITLQAVLDVAPLQFTLGEYMEGINGKADTATGRPAYKQTNNGITLGVGFCY